MSTPISRVIRPKSAARRAYNRLSRWYDAIAGSTEQKYRDLGLRLLAARPGEQILEIGYGTGHCLLALAQAVGPSGHIFGIDLSDGMRQIAQRRLQAASLSERVELVTGDAAQMPWTAPTFDAIFISFTLELFDTPEIPIVLHQCHTLLHPGGRLVLVTMVKSETPGLPERVYEWFHAKLPTVVDCRPIFARHALLEANFAIQTIALLSMWGLPVEIILSTPHPQQPPTPNSLALLHS